MKDSLSVFLDALRFGAAFLVVLHHFLQLEVVGPRFAPYVPDLGHESVLAFFVLSGFVIRFVTTQRPARPGDYALARAARIYSVVLPVLLFAVLLDGLSWWLGDTADVRLYQYQRAWLYLPLNLGFLGQSWTLTETPLSVLPYWSLCYEVVYYALYGAAFFLRGLPRLVACGLVLAVAGPKIWLLAPAWWLGVALYDLSQREPQRERWWRRRELARALVPASLLGVVAVRYSELGEPAARLAHHLVGGPNEFSQRLLGNSAPFLADGLTALCVALAILAFPHTGWSFGARASRLIRRCASYTFTLYLVHVPLIRFARQQIGIDPERPTEALLLLLVILLVTVALGHLGEHHKGLYRRALDGLVRRLPGAAWRAS